MPRRQAAKVGPRHARVRRPVRCCLRPRPHPPCSSRPSSFAAAAAPLRTSLPYHRVISSPLIPSCHPCPPVNQVRGGDRVLPADVLGGGMARAWRRERQLRVPRDGGGTRPPRRARLRRAVRGGFRVLHAHVRIVRLPRPDGLPCDHPSSKRGGGVLVGRRAQRGRVLAVRLLHAHVPAVGLCRPVGLPCNHPEKRGGGVLVS